MKKDFYEVSPASPLVAGVFRREGETVFVFTAPEKAAVELCLFHENENEPFQKILMTEEYRTGSVYAAAVSLPKEEKITYLYRVNGVYITDPYSTALRSVSTENGTMLCSVIPGPVKASTVPLKTPFEDCVLYKLHVRGFSIQRKGGLKNPGTFAGVAESIPYFHELGVNALLFMPVYEFFETLKKPYFASVQTDKQDLEVRRNYWGYAKGWYFTPKQSYSSADDADTEFADMVDALHRAGILCIAEFYFEENEDPRLVTDVLRYWLLKYQLDGFRLVGNGGWLAAVQRDPLLSGTRMLFSHYEENTAEPVREPGKKQIAVYNTAYESCLRRFLKGDPEISTGEVAWMQRRNAVTFTYVSFLAEQDGFTLADAVSYEERHNEANGQENQDGCAINYTWNCGEEGPSRKLSVRRLREKQLRNAFLLLMTGQGVPMIYAGDEVCNSQNGNNNAWCQDNEDGWVNWSRSRSAAELQDFVKKAVAFRKAHPVLHQTEPLRMMDYRSCGLPDLSYHSGNAWMQQSTQMKAAYGALYCGCYARKEDGTEDDTLYILYNMYWQEQAFALPDPPTGTKWFVKADTEHNSGFYQDGEEPSVQIKDKWVMVSARTIYILIAKKDAETGRKA